MRKQCAIRLLLEAHDDDAIHTDGFTDNLEEVLVRPGDQQSFTKI